MSSTYSSLLSQYQQHLDSICKGSLETAAPSNASTNAGVISSPLHPASRSLNVGIIGGGMSGLYSALLLQNCIPDVKVKIFEADKRIGGRVFTYHFSEEPHQFFEAGAMRLPDIESHKPLFQLIDYLNWELPEKHLELIDYSYVHQEGNRVFVNGTKQQDGRIMSVEYARKYGNELGFALGNIEDASVLLQKAMVPLIDALKSNFYDALLKYDMSLYDYLSKEIGWNEHKINYVEVMCGQTHQFKMRVLDYFFLGGFFLCDDHKPVSWKTIDGGLSNLPESCADAVRKLGGEIQLNSKIELIVQSSDERLIKVSYIDRNSPDSNQKIYETFDVVILTIPPASIRAIPKRPLWDADLENALRTAPSQPATKLGLQFRTRFWERSNLQLPGARGGQSMTDLPIRWVVYPSHGIGDSGKGVLHIYNREGDATEWINLPRVEKIKIALSNLQRLYPEVDIAHEYAGGIDENSKEFIEAAFDSPLKAVVYYPGQLSSFPAMIKPQGNIYFAGAHLSSTLTWIVSALESAKRAVEQIAFVNLGIENIQYLQK